MIYSGSNEQLIQGGSDRGVQVVHKNFGNASIALKSNDHKINNLQVAAADRHDLKANPHLIHKHN